MSKEGYLSRITIGASGLYRILVEGTLDANWSDRLAGMCIKVYGDPRYQRATLLEGRVNDQAELIGVLDSLYDLHMTILSVELLADDKPSVCSE
jgi:hypothetical protein